MGPVAGTLVLYLLVLLAVGWRFRESAADDDGFFLGGRRLGGPVAALGASASSSSAWTLLGVSGAAYAWGLSATWLVPACVSGFVLNWTVFAPVVGSVGRARGATTAIELAVGRGPGTRLTTILLSVVVLISLGAYVGAQLQGAGKTFEAVFAIPTWQSVTVGAGVVVAYTWLGGFPAVSATDAIQGSVMMATAIALPAVAVLAAGGPAAIYAALAADPALVSPFGPRPGLLGAGFALGLLGIGLGYPGQPHVAKYFLALADDPTVLRRGRRIAVAWATVVYVGMVALGLAGRALYPSLPDGEVVFVTAARDLFPAVVTGAVLAAVLSAMMSTADSQLFVAATTVTHDLGVGRGPNAARWVIAVLALLAATSALVGGASIFSRVLFGWAAMGASLGPLLLLRWVLGRRLPSTTMATVVAVGAGSAALAHVFFVPWGGPVDLRGLFVHVVPYALAMTVGWLGSVPGEGGG